jgi:hypothetical protein
MHDEFRERGRTPSGVLEAGLVWLKEPQASSIPTLRGWERKNPQGKKVQPADRGPWHPNVKGWFCAAYGPMRRLTGSSTEAVRYAATGGILGRMVTLFREDAALTESEEWLKKLHSRVLENGDSDPFGYKQLLEEVKAFLSAGLLPNGLRISKITVDHVMLTNEAGMELPMRDLSDGCRGVYACTLNLIHSMHEVYGTEGLFKQTASGDWQIARPGVVLIDEVESHLHPAWQQTFPEWLKTRFPKVQFIVTTHSPLIAQAADPGGIYVLPLQDEYDRGPRRLDQHEYEKIKWGRAEKVLLGAAFGLKSTRHSWANSKIERWQHLNAKFNAGVKLTHQEREERRDLYGQLKLALEPVDELRG